MRNRGELNNRNLDIIYLLFIILFSICFYMFSPWIRNLGGDGGDGHYALWAACARAWHNKELPLWNPYQWGGYSSVGHTQEVFYPILIILEFVFWDNSTQMLSFAIFPAYIAVHSCLGGIGMYILGRSRKKTPMVSCFVSLLVIASGCFSFGRVWAYIFGSYCWSPWLIWSLYRLVETNEKKWIAFSGLFLSLICLCSSAQGALFAVLIYVVIYAVVVWKRRKYIKEIIKTGVMFLLSGFIGMGMAATELFPFIEMTINSYRYIPGMELGEDTTRIPLSLFKEDIVTADRLNGIFGGYYGVMAISFVALLLIIIGLFRVRRKKDWLISFSIILMIGSLMYSIGFGVVDVFWYIPGFNSIRQPILYAPFFILSGGILMLEGLEAVGDVLCGSNNVRWIDIVRNSNICNWIIFFTMLVILLPHNIQGKVNLLEKVLVIIICGFIIIHKRIKKSIFNVFLIAILFLDLSQWYAFNTNDSLYTTKDASEKVIEANETTNIFFDELNGSITDGADISARYLNWSQTTVLPRNVAGVIGEKDCFAYCNPIYEKNYYIYRLFDLKKRCQLQNIKLILMGNDNEDTYVEWVETHVGKDSKLAENTVYSSYDDNTKKEIRYIDTSDLNLGAGWIVNDLVEYSSSSDVNSFPEIKDLISKLNDVDFDLSHRAYIDIDTVKNMDSLKFDNSVAINAEVNCLEYGNNRISYAVNSNTDGVLLTTEIYYPGWKVKIDGEKADILQLNYAFRGVRVEKGIHEVIFYYRPFSLIFGFVVSVVAFVLLIMCLIKRKS